MAQQTTKADGGTDDSDDYVELTEETVTTAAELVDILDEDASEDIALERAERILEVLEETGATFLKLKSSWHGNEFIGAWSEYWFAFIAEEREKSIRMSEVIEAGYPMKMAGKLRRERESRSPNERALTRYEDKAFKNWDEVTEVGDRWGESNWAYFTGEFCPKSGIDLAITTPARDDHYIVTPEGQSRGSLDEADLRVRKTVMHEYESNGRPTRDEKFAVEGATYEAFVSANLKNILPFMPVERDGEVVEQGTFHSFNGDYWVVGMDGLQTFIDYATDIGFSVGVHADYADRLEEN